MRAMEMRKTTVNRTLAALRRWSRAELRVELLGKAEQRGAEQGTRPVLHVRILVPRNRISARVPVQPITALATPVSS